MALYAKTPGNENLRDFSKGCKCSLDILSCNIRAQISDKHMEVI